MEPVFLTLDELLVIHRDQIQRYGGSLGVRDLGLLESAIAMPKAMFGGQWLHADLPSMAAAYLFHLTKNHPFVDGNKRVGAATASVFLLMNACSLSCSEDAYADLVLGIADGTISKEAATEFFHQHVRRSS